MKRLKLCASMYLAAIISQKGSDAWWYMSVEELLPDKYRGNASEYEKGTDTMDVWFDSGIKVQQTLKLLFVQEFP